MEALVLDRGRSEVRLVADSVPADLAEGLWRCVGGGEIHGTSRTLRTCLQVLLAQTDACTRNVCAPILVLQARTRSLSKHNNARRLDRGANITSYQRMAQALQVCGCVCVWGGEGL